MVVSESDTWKVKGLLDERMISQILDELSLYMKKNHSQ
jgi:hypothetical protein